MKQKPSIKWDVVLVWAGGIAFSIFCWYWFVQFIAWLGSVI